MAFEKAHPRPKVTRVPFADQVAMRVWQMLLDANVVTGTLPPRRTSGDAS